MSTTVLHNDRLLRALLRQPVDQTPVWIMRQAGRYLPEYRALRQRAGSFMALCQTPELACEVTLQPLARFPLDAAILFSDILTIPDAMGLGLSFVEGEGPRFERVVRSARDVTALGVPDPATDLRYVEDAIHLIRDGLNGRVPLIGFCGSPWTVACYMVEGTANKRFPHITAMRQQDPRTLHALLDLLARASIDYLNAQIAAGVQAVMIFDSWGGMLEHAAYSAYSLQYVARIFAGLTREREGRVVPRILFTRQGHPWLEQMADSGCDALGVDWEVSLAEARRRVGDRVALQGNLDPAILRTTPAQIRAAVADTLADYAAGPGHVFNLGHGITPDIAPDHLGELVEAVHTLSRAYHKDD